MRTQSSTRAASVRLENAELHGDEMIQTRIGDIELINNYFDGDASRRLFDEMDYQRATQAYIWSYPLVSITTWRDNQCAAFGLQKDTDFVVHKSLKEKRGIVTGNLTTPCILNFISLKGGPLEISYPAGKTAGAALDFWQRPIFDLGVIGPDKGAGGTYILVGPGIDPATHKRDGAHVYQSKTTNVCVGLLILDKTPGYFEKFTQEFRMGRAGQSIAPSRFIEGKNVEWSATAPRGLDYWRKLSGILNEELVREVDKAWMALLLPLGIEKGKPFKPDDRQRTALLKGAAMGELMARNLQVNPRYAEPYWMGNLLV